MNRTIAIAAVQMDANPAPLTERLAREYQARGCCTLTAGIFVMTAANAVEEARAEGRELDIPYWRTLKADGFLNEKFPNGLKGHKALLEAEGFTVAQKGKRYYVPGYEDVLFCEFEGV